MPEHRRSRKRKRNTPKEMENAIKTVLNIIKRNKVETVRYRLTHDKWQYGIFFKDGFLDQVRTIKNCKSDHDLAKLLGITRAYLSMLRGRKKPVSQEIIVRMAILLGNIESNWHAPFVILPMVPMVDSNHPSNNMKKYNGYEPYEKYSIAAEFRGHDSNVEKKD